MSDIVRIVTFPLQMAYIRNSSIAGQFEGIFVEIWRRIAEELVLAYNITTAPNYDDSDTSENKFCQLLDCLEDGLADLALQAFPTKISKFDPCHPHPPNYAATSPFMVKNVRVATLEKANDVFDMSILLGKGLIDPYTQLYNVVALVMYSLALVTISSIHKKWAPGGEREFSFRQSTWYFWSIFMSIGSDHEPISLAGQMLTSLWSFWAIFFWALFTANLAAILGSNLAHRPLTKISQLSAKGSKVIAYSFPYLQSFLLNLSTTPIFDLRNENRLKCVPENVTNQFLREELMKENVLIAPELHLEYLQKKDENLRYLYMLDGSLSFEPYGFAFRKNWPLASKVDDLIFEFASSGIIDEMIRNNLPQSNSEPTKQSTEITAYKLIPFYVALAANLLGTAIVAIGTISYGRKKKTQIQEAGNPSSTGLQETDQTGTTDNLEFSINIDESE